MIMADVLKILFIILGLMITTVGYWLFFEAMTPRLVERAQTLYAGRPFRVFFLGALCGVPATILCVILMNGGAVGRLLGISGIFALVLTGLLGSAGLARHVGTQLRSPSDASQPWKRVLRGGSVLTVTFVLPGLGWFVLMPYALLSGLGAAILAVRAYRTAPVLEGAAVPPAEMVQS